MSEQSRAMMSWRLHLFLLLSLGQFFGSRASINPEEWTALMSLSETWKTTALNWEGSDPCDGKWVGIKCEDDRVISIALASNNLRGALPSDITGLSELKFLDLSYNDLAGPLPSQIGNLKNLTILILVGCGLSGEIPQSLGSLQNLTYLSLKSNNFIGGIPSSLGNLSKLFALDLTNNSLDGAIPVSPGLDTLVVAQHFHLGKNKLSGAIPPGLFSSNMALRHLILDNNQLTGNLPSSVGIVKSLEVIQLHRNLLRGPVPTNLNNLTSLLRLQLANNQLTGPLPNLAGMAALSYVDMSNNPFDPTDVIPPWFSTLQSLTSLIMQNTSIRGPLPVSLFSLPQLQTVDLKNNQINGTLNIGSNYRSSLRLIDLRNNKIDSVNDRPDYRAQIILIGNPACMNLREQRDYCMIHQDSNSMYSTPMTCKQNQCRSNEVLSPTCKCAQPYSGYLVFYAPSFSSYENNTIFASLEQALKHAFIPLGLHVDSLSLSNPRKTGDDYLELYLQVFPSGLDHFNRTGISGIGNVLSHQTFRTPSGLGSYCFMPSQYFFEAASGKSNTALIIGAAAGGCVLIFLLLFAAFYGFRQKRRAETAIKKSDPFASWDSKSNSGGVPQLKGARSFMFQELKKCTNNFSDDNAIGIGGYGKVYRGILSNGQLIAIKRAQQGSMQGGLEFKTEIELLSRVHHKNLVGLIGYCFDQGEQMLIYEYIPNGTLKDNLNGRTGIRLDWLKRLQIALGAARGVQYLHDLANPPIIHRDIKSNNVLLDERLNAKVSDFGLSKPMGDSGNGPVITQVKGTMGYLDPEYYMTQQLTEKSDVYSFGVLLFEILTSRNPIEKGKYIVREVKEAKDPSKDMYNLQTLIDPIVACNTAPGTVERFVNLALMCVKKTGNKRPDMSEVVKELESIIEFTGLNPNTESYTSTSNSYEGAAKHFQQPYSNESLFTQSGKDHSSSVEAVEPQ